MISSLTRCRAVRHSLLDRVRVNFSRCCPPCPQPPPPPAPDRGCIEPPPPDCCPCPVPPNPCCPQFPHGKDTWKKYRIIFFIAVPLIAIQMFHALSHHPPPKGECREYEYMRRRNKRFPWGGSTGDGQESLFHNPHTNFLPGDCGPPPSDECD